MNIKDQRVTNGQRGADSLRRRECAEITYAKQVNDGEMERERDRTGERME